MQGVKHLIQCTCVLPQYRNRRESIFHKFTVFSVIEDDDLVRTKLVECTNCGAVHKVHEIGKSERIVGREDLSSVLSKDDIKRNLPDNVCSILESYSVDLPTWEEVQFTMDYQDWGREVILKQEDVQGMTQGKLLRILGPNTVRIESFSREDLIG